jgi:hypothetical protein
VESRYLLSEPVRPASPTAMRPGAERIAFLKSGPASFAVLETSFRRFIMHLLYAVYAVGLLSLAVILFAVVVRVPEPRKPSELGLAARLWLAKRASSSRQKIDAGELYAVNVAIQSLRVRKNHSREESGLS